MFDRRLHQSTKYFHVTFAELVNTGDPLKVIAHRMNITESTLKVYACRLYRQVGVGSRVELISKYHAGEISILQNNPEEELTLS